MARNLKCHCRRRYVTLVPFCARRQKLNYGAGPAHAVYFATYEAVKQGMGGNNGTEHHPLAAGKLSCVGGSRGMVC